MATRFVRTLRTTFLMAACLAVIPTVVQAAQLTVDDGTKADCPSAGFTSIQAAVNAAAAGDTISICPGTYQEAAVTGGSGIQVNKALTIKGAGSDLVTIKPPAGITPSPGPPGSPPGTPGPVRDAFGNVISVTAGPTTISGVTVDASNPTGSGTVDAGVVFLDGGNGNATSGSVLRNSRISLGQRVGISGTGIGVIAAVPNVSTGSFTFTLSGNLIQSYSKAGVVIDASKPDTTLQNTQLNATIQNNRIEGGGPAGDVPQGQQGIQVGRGATAQITGNSITLNRSADSATPPCTPATCTGASEGVLIFDEPFDARFNANTVTGNNIQGNGFGVLVFDSANIGTTGGQPNPGVNIDARNNYWGSPNGPTVVDFQNPNAPSSSDSGDQVQGPNQGVNYTPFSQVQLSLPGTPAAEPDAAPTVTITSPSDGATVTPGTATTITATASDDIGVTSVTFRKGDTVLGTSNGPTFTATYTPTAAEAGTSQVITATATDSRGQTSTTAISVRVAGPAVTPPPPPPPPTAEDKPPTVSISAPKRIVLGKSATIRANATDDKGVASVRFYAGTRRICTDTSAPYTCKFKPRARDLGKVTLIAIATDTSGQTAAAFRSTRVVRPRRHR